MTSSTPVPVEPVNIINHGVVGAEVEMEHHLEYNFLRYEDRYRFYADNNYTAEQQEYAEGFHRFLWAPVVIPNDTFGALS